MRRPRVSNAAFALAIVAALGGCSASAPSYRNVNHPAYGAAEQKSDLEQCRSKSSQIVMTSGYDDKSEVKVDEAKAQACMTERGWQAVR
jgi:hypothetical protein